MLDSGLTGNAPWGRVYQGIKSRDPDHWLLPLVKGNAVQQISDTALRNNRYLQNVGVVFNQGHLMDLRISAGNLFRPGCRISLPGGKLGVFDITTPEQDAKIGRCAADVWANIFY